MKKTKYQPFEIVLIDNGSTKKETFDFYEQLLKEYSNIRIIEDPKPFNFSRLVNFGVSQASGEFICLLNNDTEILEECWLEEMLYYAVKPEVGVVGAKLYYPDGKIQHAGVIVGFWGLADHAFKGCMEENDYMFRLTTPQEYLAVTAACMMFRKEIFKMVEGFDETLKLNFQDLDFCLKVFERGYKIIYTPYAQLIHHEHATRGKPDNKEKIKQLEKEKKIIKRRWKKYIGKDPYYHPFLDLNTTRFSLKTNMDLSKIFFS